MTINILFFVLVTFLGVGLTLSILRLDRLCSTNSWWRQLGAKHETSALLLSSFLKLLLAVGGLVLNGLLIWLLDVRENSPVLAVSALSFVGGMWGTYYFKKNDYLKW